MLTLSYAIRNVFRHKLRSLVTLASIGIGCVAIIFAGGFFEDMYIKTTAVQVNSQTGHIQIFRRGYFEAGSGNSTEFLIEDPTRIQNLIKQIPTVRSVSPRLFLSGVLSTGETTIPFMGMGVDPALEPATKSQSTRLPPDGVSLVEGEALNAARPGDVLLGKGLAETFAAKPGDEMILLTRTIDGSMNGKDVRVSGTFASGLSEVDDFALQLPLATTQELLRTDTVQSLVVKLHKTEDLSAAKASLLNLFQQENLNLELRTFTELSDFSTKVTDLFQRFYFVLKVIIVFVVILSIYNTLNMSVSERTAEIGTIMSMGFNRSRVISLFLAEGTALGVIGGGLGVFIGSLLTFASGVVGIIMPPTPGVSTSWVSEPRVVLANVLFAFLLSVICAFVSAFLPAWRASKLEIAEALRSAR